MENNPSVIIIEEDKKTINEMEKKLASQKTLYEFLNGVGIFLTASNAPAFILSMLSPFDFEGPMLEMLTGMIMTTGIVLKTISKNKLKEIEAISTDGQTIDKVDLSQSPEDLNILANTLNSAANYIGRKK